MAGRRGAAAALAEARSTGLPVRGGSLRVVLSGWDASAAVVRVGGTVEARAFGTTQALVPAGRLDELASDVRSGTVRPPARFKLAAVAGEGVASTNAAAVHAAGSTGTGVKVGIIDGGFSGYQQRITDGDLPNTVVTQDFCGGRLASATAHGTGVAEIVHEMAPGAQLYLICMNSEVTLAQAVAYAQAQGIEIINHSVGWFNTSRGDGSGAAGSPDAIVADARANGIIWVNAAGNEAQEHWSGTFADGDGDGLHDFAGGDEGNSFLVAAGATACASLRWDAWPTTATDFDLYLIRSSDGSVLASSETDQASVPGPPVEEACYQNTTGSTLGVAAAITIFSASSSPRFDLFVDGVLEYQTAPGSILEPASSPAALAVGAFCWSNGASQTYSSRGPSIDGRIKPDIAAPDAVTNATYGASSSCSTGFTGTSAAAPHVAGALATLKQREPGLSIPTLESLILSSAAHENGGADDSVLGAGRLRVAVTDLLERELAYTELLGGPGSDGELVVGSITGDGAALLPTLPGTGDGNTLAFSPDGTKIALQGTDGNEEIFIVPVEGGTPVRLTTNTASDLSPAWSPDGQKIAFSSDRDGDAEIYVANADGTNVQQLTTHPLADITPTWSPDGQTIVFASNRLGPPDALDLYSMTTTGTDQARILAATAEQYEPAYSPDGSKIAFTHESGSERDIFVMNSDGTGAANVTTDIPGRAEKAAWAPDGSRLSATTDTAGRLLVFSADGSGKTRVPTLTDQLVSASAWRPDPVSTPRAVKIDGLLGTPAIGGRLAASRGTWVGNPLRLSYQWRRCDTSGNTCLDIGGATDRSYTVTQADTGKTIRAMIRATNGPGSTVAMSPPSALVPSPAPTSPPASGGGGGGSGTVDLALTGSVSPSTTTSGGTVTWAIRATDLTSALALGVNVAVTLPAGAALVSSEVSRGPGCPRAAPNGVMSCGLDFLNGQAPYGDIRIVTTLTGTGDFVLQARVGYVNPDPNPGNDSIALRATIPSLQPAPPPSRAPQTGKTLTGNRKANTLRGTASRDTIRGLAGNDRLFGLAGADRLFGGAGADTLNGGTGKDLLDGGPGADRITARDGTADTIRCGTGRDTVTADRFDRPAKDCEVIRRS